MLPTNLIQYANVTYNQPTTTNNIGDYTMSETPKTIYDYLAELNTDKAKDFATQRVWQDKVGNGAEPINDDKGNVDKVACKKAGIREVTQFTLDNKQWHEANAIETLTIKNREYDKLKLSAKGYVKTYRFFKTDLNDEDFNLMEIIRGRLSALELTLDAIALQIKMERKKKNGKVKMDKALVNKVIADISKCISDGADFMQGTTKDDDELIVY
jgi:hypothetical protein